MTAKKISQLTAAANAADTDQFPVNQGGTTKRVTRAQVLARQVSVTIASPILLSTVTIPVTANRLWEIMIVAADGSPLTAGGTPKIQAGSVVGQILMLRGTSDANAFTINGSGGGDGVVTNGACVLRNCAVIKFVWDGSLWVEVSRNDK